MSVESAEQLDFVGLSPGTMLRAGRESQGMSERETAERLNWLPRYVSMIEQDDYQALRSPAFARGYIRAYGRLLNLDEEELIAAFEVLTDGAFEGGKGRRVTTQPLQLQRTGVGIVVGLLTLAMLVAGLWWLQSAQAVSESAREQSARALEQLPAEEVSPAGEVEG